VWIEQSSNNPGEQQELDISEYHKMHTLESDYWWFQGRMRVILTMLDELRRQGLVPGNPTILDIGCGTGMLLEKLQKLGFGIGLDFSPVALEYCRHRSLPHLARADVHCIPVADNSANVLLALDLVEHVRDDRQVLSEFFRVLKPGGVAIISVPAHKGLWSNHDVALHHFRRYEKSEFYDLVTSAGFSPIKYTYSLAVAYIPALIFRSAKKMLISNSPPHTDEFRLPRFVNAVLRETVHLEARWLRHRNLPFGLSILCIAQKPAGAVGP
jgi:ubiquinone/menaquinone biosynthesis C-methylase UbiE